MLEMRLAATIQALRTTATGLNADEDLASLLSLASLLPFSQKKNVFFVRGPLLRPPF